MAEQDAKALGARSWLRLVGGRVRRLPRCVESDHDLLVLWCLDREVVGAERPLR